MKLVLILVFFILSITSDASIQFKVTDNIIKFFHDGNRLINESGGVFYKLSNIIYLNQVAVGEIVSNEAKLCENVYTKNCTYQVSEKFPSSDDFTKKVVRTILVTLSRDSEDKFNGKINKNLFPYILNSPNQKGAGSCLLMASTGAMEILLNQRNSIPGKLEGDTDLSERFLMNITDFENIKLENWRTDSILLFNHIGGGVLNRDYRFTMGTYKKDSNGNLMPAIEGSVGASYGAYYNWITDKSFPYKEYLKPLPTVSRDLLRVDADNNQWNTGKMIKSDILKIKNVLDHRNKPVLVIYNHFGVWHAVLIVGYNDNKETKECPFVKKWIEYQTEDMKEYLASDDQDDIKRGKRIKKQIDKVSTSVNEKGCQQNGIFYVRDSIYKGSDDLMYDYDLKKKGEEVPYSKKIVEHSYDWLLHLGNHSYVIY